MYVDAMFGNLGHILRMLGFDTKIADPKLKDSEILKQVISSNRILITRDFEFYTITTQFLSNNNLNPKNVLYIKSQELSTQIHLVFMHINQKPSEFLWTNPEKLPFKPRCSLCNELLLQVEKKDILTQISEGTAENYNIFWKCSNPNCKEQIYWIGRHWDYIRSILEKMSI
jgi:uncharacterized protein with PIN domain